MPTDVVTQYLKTFQFLGWDDSLTSHGVNMESYMGGCYVSIFDMTTSLQASIQAVAPVARQGQTR